MRFWTKSLIARLIIYFLAFSAISLALIVLILFGNVQNTLTQSIYDRLGAVSTLKEDELNRWVLDNKNEIAFLAQRAEVRQNLLTISEYDENSNFYEAAYNRLSTYLNTESIYHTSFQEIFLLSPVGGKVLISTIQQNEGQYRVSDTYYTRGRLDIYVQNVYTSPQTGKPTMTIATPVLDTNGSLVGVLAAHVDLERLDSIILQRSGLGETGETYLVDKFNNFISAAQFGEREYPRGVHTEGINTALQGIDGESLYTNYNNVPVIGVYKWLDNWDMALLAEISQQEAFEPARRLTVAVFIVGLATAIILSFGAYLIARQIARPILAITDTASQIAAGNLEATAPIMTQDEIGELAMIFNAMAEQIKQLIQTLEQRVSERTTDLEIARKYSEIRAAKLQSVGEISNFIASEQKLEILLSLTTRLVSERLNYYHTGIFLLDERSKFAILQAANSEGGKNMLKRGHKLEIGESGIVGHVAKFGVPRIALDVGQDAVYFNNPDLPNTRSEIALPLKYQEKIIGVLDVQSEKPGAFTEEDANILGILADQIAIAIENARLFTQTQQALNEAQTLYRQNLQEGWANFGSEESIVGYHQNLTSGKKLTQPVNTDEIKHAINRSETTIFHADGNTQEPSIVIPIKLRGQIIGVISIKAPTHDRQWTTNEIGLTEAISERLSLALENARLIQESQQRVIKEHTISEMTSKIGSSINLQNVLQTAVEELGRSIPGSEVIIKFQGAAMDHDKE